MAVVFREWDVAKMERCITAKRFIDWEAFAQLEPWTFFPEVRADWRAASIREMVYNVAVEKKHRKPMKHFMLPFEEEAKSKRKQTPEQQFEMLKLLAIMHSTATPAEQAELDRAHAAMKITEKITFADT